MGVPAVRGHRDTQPSNFRESSLVGSPFVLNFQRDLLFAPCGQRAAVAWKFCSYPVPIEFLKLSVVVPRCENINKHTDCLSQFL